MTEYTLKYPIIDGGSEIKTINLKRPKIKDQLAVEGIKDPVEQEITLCSRLTGLDKALIGEMDLYDYKCMQELLKDFLSPDKNTGGSDKQ